MHIKSLPFVPQKHKELCKLPYINNDGTREENRLYTKTKTIFWEKTTTHGGEYYREKKEKVEGKNNKGKGWKGKEVERIRTIVGHLNVYMRMLES